MTVKDQDAGGGASPVEADEAQSPAKGTEVPELGGEPKAPELGDETDDDEAPDDVEASTVDDGDDATADGDSDDDAGDDEAIEYDLEAPEGEPPYREAVVDAYKAVAAELKLPADDAKKLLDTMYPVLRDDMRKQVEDQVDAQTETWKQELVERHGKRLNSVVQLATKALKTGSEEFQELILQSPLRANPEFIDFLAKWGKRITNDKSVKSGRAPKDDDQNLTPEQRIARAYDSASAR